MTAFLSAQAGSHVDDAINRKRLAPPLARILASAPLHAAVCNTFAGLAHFGGPKWRVQFMCVGEGGACC